jgi:hypothetical protein
LQERVENHRLLDWLQEYRYNLFLKTRLAFEYRLASKLRKIRWATWAV